MMGLTIGAWVVDFGILLQLAKVIQYRLQVSPELGWRGPFWMICLAALVGSSIVCSIALVLTTQQRWARIAALAVAGGLPAAAAFAMVVMFLGALGLAFSGGRLN
jgi:hypothetical protein